MTALINLIMMEENKIVEKTEKIAILIPAYNEEKYIEGVILECLKYNLDIVIVDDGSKDSTKEIIKKFLKKTGQNIPNIILLEHTVNRGKGEALKTGFNYAKEKNYKGVITIDADGQHRVSEIRNFINEVESSEPDIIVGSRFQNVKGMPFIRLATNFITSWIISLIAGKKINDVQSGFRYIGKKFLENIKLETKNFDTEPEILLKAGWHNYVIKNIPITTIYHKNFISHVNPVKDTIKFFKLVFVSIYWKIKFMRSHTRL